MKTIVLERGDTRVTVAPGSGGRIAQIAVFEGTGWLPLLAGPPLAGEERGPLGWGCFPMAPWPNRIAGGRFLFEGTQYVLPGNDAGHAIHGLVYDRAWKVDWRTSAAIGMSVSLEECGWPWRGRASQRIDVVDDGLRLSLEVHAASGSRFPAGVGWHPWFRRASRPSDADICLQFAASERYELRDMIPTGSMLEIGGSRDFRQLRPIGARRLDDCYRGINGPLRLRWGEIELAMRLSPNLTHAVVYSPEEALCVEPQTCAIDAFNLDARGVPAGTAIVEPGRPLVATASWRWATTASR